MFRLRPLHAMTLGSFIGMLALVGCGAATPHPIAQQPTVVPTIAYLPPTVIPDTPTPATPTPAATSTPTAHPTNHTPTPRPTATPAIPQPPGGVPNIAGQVILVSITQQWLWVYQNRQLVYNTPVTTGRPELPTPDGIYPMQYKLSNITFFSPWPVGSPYYYSPEHVDYALYFLYNGYYIHDAPWRHVFGPGTELPYTDANGTQETGSHGCIEVPVSAGAWLYTWAQDGLTIDIVGATPAPVATATPKPPPATPTPTAMPPTIAPSPTP